MSSSALQSEALSLLYEQHRLYTEELGSTHAGLGKLYKKLSKLERKMQDREQGELSRQQVKKLWWTRTVTRQSLEKLESQRNDLCGRLQRCRDLIVSSQVAPDVGAQATPGFWTTHFPPTPYIVATPMSFPPTPYVMTPFTPYFPAVSSSQYFVSQEEPDFRYWDLSMLAESQSMSSADSVYFDTEPVQHSTISVDGGAGTSEDSSNIVSAQIVAAVQSHEDVSTNEAEAENTYLDCSEST